MLCLTAIKLIEINQLIPIKFWTLID